MSNETKQAIEWALLQNDEFGNPIVKEAVHFLTDKVREYFNANNIVYDSFSYDDLKPYFVSLSE